MSMGIPAGINFPAANMGANWGAAGAASPINPLGMDSGMEGFLSLSKQIASYGLDAATMKQLNNPTANPLSGQQSSMISGIIKELQSEKFTQMAAKDKLEKDTKKTEKDEDKEDTKAADARKERLEEIRLLKEEENLKLLQYIALNAKQQQPQLQQPVQVQQGLQVQPQRAQQGQLWPSQSYTG